MPIRLMVGMGVWRWLHFTVSLYEAGHAFDPLLCLLRQRIRLAQRSLVG